jgi:hypothetical protein
VSTAAPTCGRSRVCRDGEVAQTGSAAAHVSGRRRCGVSRRRCPAVTAWRRRGGCAPVGGGTSLLAPSWCSDRQI